MAWVKVDDAFYDHPKFLGLSHADIGRWLTALAWCNRNTTDGRVPAVALARLGIDADDVAVLVERGLWSKDDDGWRVHDYAAYQPTRDDALSLHSKRAAAGRKGAAQRWQDGKPDSKPMAESWPVPVPGPVTDEGQEHRALALIESPTFEEFYAIYPRHMSVADARRAWAKVTKTTDPVVIVEAARRFAADPNLRPPKYLPYPATWLRAEGWKNEPEVAETIGKPESQGMRLIRRAAAQSNGGAHGIGADDPRPSGPVLGPLPDQPERR